MHFQVVSQQKRDDRKSRLIIEDAAKDDQIKKFMMEIDQQNIQMDQQKKKLEARVSKFESSPLFGNYLLLKNYQLFVTFVGASKLKSLVVIVEVIQIEVLS